MRPTRITIHWSSHVIYTGRGAAKSPPACKQMNTSLKVERPKSLTDIAIDRIRDAIVEGKLAFGEALSESSLAQRLEISKTPVHEALLWLKHEGLVDAHPHRGWTVFRPTALEIAALCEFRALVECAALGEAAARNPQHLVTTLGSILADMRSAEATPSLERFATLDSAFHEAIVECSDNIYLRTAYQFVACRARALRHRVPANNDHFWHCHESHAGIVTLVAAGAADEARALLNSHILQTEATYIRASSNH